MDFETSIKTCFTKYATFSGRASKSECWWFLIFCCILNFVVTVLDIIIMDTGRPNIIGSFLPVFYFLSLPGGPGGGLFGMITALVLITPSLAVVSRRFHDGEEPESGWMQLIALTIIGIPAVIVLMLRKGSEEDNFYGKPPPKLKKIYVKIK
tara:strand:- start:1300 stop:1755 length:456 start_codon:yes stop_codon:yes gene_type:complete